VPDTSVAGIPIIHHYTLLHSPYNLSNSPKGLPNRQDYKNRIFAGFLLFYIPFTLPMFAFLIQLLMKIGLSFSLVKVLSSKNSANFSIADFYSY
jgi:hypothetical protein